MLYATLAEAKQEMVATTTVDDSILLPRLRRISRRLDREMGSNRELFAPTVETRRIPVNAYTVNSAYGTLRVPGSLLELTSVVVSGTTLVVGTNVEGYPDSSYPPFQYLHLMDCCAGWYSYCAGDCDPLTTVITGVWGIHRDYANAWAKVDDIVTTALTASLTDTTLKVADVDGVDIYGLTPRISAGNLLRINTEFMEVIATDTAANTATVRRAVNGSTLAAHNIGDDVEVWMVEESVKQVVAKQAGLMYARRGAYTTVEVQGMSEVRFPADLLIEVRAVMQEFAYGH